MRHDFSKQNHRPALQATRNAPVRASTVPPVALQRAINAMMSARSGTVSASPGSVFSVIPSLFSYINQLVILI